jgi:cob(I)alamin adenosyltransferase
MKIYTKFGDQGKTALRAGIVVDKGDPQVELLGTCDELNSMLGWVAVDAPDAAVRESLERTQRQLFSLGAALAQPASIPDEFGQRAARWTAVLESEIDRWTETLPKLANFILPGGSPAAAGLHLARSTCRRLERLYFRQTLQRFEPIGVYLNRLGDWLFVAARWTNQRQGVSDIVWRETLE